MHLFLFGNDICSDVPAGGVRDSADPQFRFLLGAYIDSTEIIFLPVRNLSAIASAELLYNNMSIPPDHIILLYTFTKN